MWAPATADDILIEKAETASIIRKGFVMRLGFWVGGSSAYAAELHHQFQSELRALRNQMRLAETIHELEAAKQQIAELRIEYRRQRKAVSQSLF